MSGEKSTPQPEQTTDWWSVGRLVFGACGTVFWLALVFSVVEEKGGLEKVRALELNAFGDFLAGSFAPLAFFWFVLAYFQQGAELKLQREELGHQRVETARLANEAARQADAIRDNELHARRDTFMRVRDLAGENLQTAAYRFIWKVYQHWSYNRDWIASHVADIRQRVSQGENHVVFDEPIIAIHRILKAQNISPPPALLRAAPAAKEAALQYVEIFEFLLTLASEADRVEVGKEPASASIMRPMLIQRRSAKLYAAYCILLERPIKKLEGEDWPQTLEEIQG